MIGHIYITGLIGSEYDSNGKVTNRGVELQDIISQFQLNKGSELIHVHITSEGGSVATGKKIAEYLKSHNHVVTIAETLCASMATEIHLAVPIERRKVVAGTKYVIHQPMVSMQVGVALNADQLNELAEDIAETEKDMLAMYIKATGLDKTALSLLMKQETALTPEQCKQYGFCSEIIEQTNFKAVALITPKQKTNEMATFIQELKDLKDIVIKAMTKDEKKKLAIVTKKIALDLTTVDDFKIVVDTEEETPKVGDKVMTEDGSPLDAGKYEFAQGILVVVDGAIAEILPPAEASAPTEAEKELAELKAKHEALIAEREAEKVAFAELTKDVQVMAKLTSTYKPKSAIAQFKKEVVTKENADYNAVKSLRAEKKNK